MSKSKLECIKLNAHAWSSSAGGYWCHRCGLWVSDNTVAEMRKGNADILDDLLQQAGDASTKWIDKLHFWTEGKHDL